MVQHLTHKALVRLDRWRGRDVEYDSVSSVLPTMDILSFRLRFYANGPQSSGELHWLEMKYSSVCAINSKFNSCYQDTYGLFLEDAWRLVLLS